MKTTGIIAAMKIEAESIISIMENVTVYEISGMRFSEGEIFGNKAVVCVCGVGKVFAAACAQTMILKFGVDEIINTGVGGTLSDKLPIGIITVADKVVQHDMDTSAIGDPVGMISGINVTYIDSDKAITDRLISCIKKLNKKYCVGTVASGDKFIADKESKKRISETFSAIACEMEGAAIGQICYINSVPFAVTRAISDGESEDVHIDYASFAKSAAESSAEIIKEYFKSTVQ